MVDAVLQSLSIVFIEAVVFMHIENWSADRDPKLEFFECIYFIVTTMTTGPLLLLLWLCTAAVC